jgi:hypothetical protein
MAAASTTGRWRGCGEARPTFAIGFAFAAQELPRCRSSPPTSRSMRIVTEQGVSGTALELLLDAPPASPKGRAMRASVSWRCDGPGRPRRDHDTLPRLRAEWRLDFVVVNAENATSGAGCRGRMQDDCWRPGPM